MSAKPMLLEADFTLLADQFMGICRRGAKRYHLNLGTVAWLTVDEDASPQEVWLVNISETGIGFRSEWPLLPGTILVLELAGNAAHRVMLTGKVVHSTKHDKGNWLVGCQFAKRLEAEDLEDLL